MPHLISLIVSEKFYQELPKEDQEILIEAQEIAKVYAREQSDARISEKIQVIKDSGTEIITPDKALYRQMIEASEPVYEEIEKVVSPEVFEAYTGNVMSEK